ncbi:hypothetical protein H112_07545 [Trichophyton rubrum D6]|uniref:Uncharacterized protein n=3 Tax=Trichophyton TaxID=5550 RepID=F2SE70_TRIRC|nr:uncharacterized protein TERG_00148 [Trichophyton rubrum CBS 118892]EZF11356.1 hypothetical protein H100_07572 [Trichophyton rubrum MR850]EZF38180.1 hypothetical protein H102_07535 [Trichophyton rubrum CBS 100081]EZF48854.1 hypothetical protein H103_07558 [Trichophyton rubrum CBS 288.86]EZF59525.1 hypothetical protein H104_07506 [Trichophyton rubrum CBS 289.86]EZF70036.1 hypothetical protein H105_07563 [Trichophyton soudanense CBS 452.61]EZF80882.1 hypothetical protein H110_07551 [Trichophy
MACQLSTVQKSAYTRTPLRPEHLRTVLPLRILWDMKQRPITVGAHSSSCGFPIWIVDIQESFVHRQLEAGNKNETQDKEVANRTVHGWLYTQATQATGPSGSVQEQVPRRASTRRLNGG